MLPWKLQKRQILTVNQNLPSVYFSLGKSQLVSCYLSLAMIWQITHTHKLPKMCSATVGMVTTVQVGACKVLYINLGSPILAGSPLQPTLNY